MDKTVRVAVDGGASLNVPAAAGILVWSVPHRPWAFFARQVVSAGTEEDARRLLVESLVSNRQDVTVEGIPSGMLASGRVLSVQREPGSVTIQAESDGPGLLVLNDAWWPGWTASIDGRPVSIRRADALIRAVEWPPGRHLLAMRYDPPEVRNGLMISVAGLFAIAALLAYAAWQAHRARI